MDDLPELRATVPALEPDPVLLGQLVELSAASTAAAGRTSLRPVRALSVGAAALGLVAATSWIAGALPGVPSPIAPERAPGPAPSAPATPSRTSDVRVPETDAAPTPGASRPHTEAPGVVPPTGTPGWTPPGKPSSTADGGRAIGLSPSKHPDAGKHLGQQKPSKSRSGKHRKRRSPLPSPSARPTTPRPMNAPTTGP